MRLENGGAFPFGKPGKLAGSGTATAGTIRTSGPIPITLATGALLAGVATLAGSLSLTLTLSLALTLAFSLPLSFALALPLSLTLTLALTVHGHGSFRIESSLGKSQCSLSLSKSLGGRGGARVCGRALAGFGLGGAAAQRTLSGLQGGLG